MREHFHVPHCVSHLRGSLFPLCVYHCMCAHEQMGVCGVPELRAGTFPDLSPPQVLGLLVTATPALLCVRSGIRTSGHLLLVASTSSTEPFPWSPQFCLGVFNFYNYQFVKMTPQKNNRKMKTTISPSSMLSCVYWYFH